MPYPPFHPLLQAKQAVSNEPSAMYHKFQHVKMMAPTGIYDTAHQLYKGIKRLKTRPRERRRPWAMSVLMVRACAGINPS
jgi:hypothetical protein